MANEDNIGRPLEGEERLVRTTMHVAPSDIEYAKDLSGGSVGRGFRMMTTMARFFALLVEEEAKDEE